MEASDTTHPTPAFSDKSLTEGLQSPTLGPAYFEARDVAARYMEKFEAEHFKPLIDKMVDEVRERLWGDFQDFLLSDTELNLQGEMWRMVDGVVEAILGGKPWALNKYALGERHDCEAVRAAVAKHIPAELQDKRVADLEAELERLKRDIEFYRRRS